MGKPSSMDAKYKDDLFRKYVQFHEGSLEPSPSRLGSDEHLRVAASALLSLPKGDPVYRFRLIQFYEVAGGSLCSLRSSSMRAMICAFSLLETVGINLFLHPWKKEFRSIKVRPTHRQRWRVEGKATGWLHHGPRSMTAGPCQPQVSIRSFGLLWARDRLLQCPSLLDLLGLRWPGGERVGVRSLESFQLLWGPGELPLSQLLWQCQGLNLRPHMYKVWSDLTDRLFKGRKWGQRDSTKYR